MTSVSYGVKLQPILSTSPSYLITALNGKFHSSTDSGRRRNWGFNHQPQGKKKVHSTVWFWKHLYWFHIISEIHQVRFISGINQYTSKEIHLGRIWPILNFNSKLQSHPGEIQRISFSSPLQYLFHVYSLWYVMMLITNL